MSETAARDRAIGCLDGVGIPAAARRIDHYPHQFAGGMRQRVVIALAARRQSTADRRRRATTALDVSIRPR